MSVVAQELLQTGMDTPVIITDTDSSCGGTKKRFETKCEDGMQVGERETDDNR